MDYNQSSCETIHKKVVCVLAHASTYELRIIRLSGQVDLAKIVICTLGLLIEIQTVISTVFLFSRKPSSR